MFRLPMSEASDGRTEYHHHQKPADDLQGDEPDDYDRFRHHFVIEQYERIVEAYRRTNDGQAGLEEWL